MGDAAGSEGSKSVKTAKIADLVSVLEGREFTLFEACKELSGVCEQYGLGGCETFLAKHHRLLNALQDVMKKDLALVTSDDEFKGGVDIDLIKVKNHQVHYNISSSFATLLPKRFNYFELSEHRNCRIWIGAMFRKHLVARAGLARLQHMSIAETEPLSDLRRFVGTAVITEDLMLLDYIRKTFFAKKGEVTIHYPDTVPYIARQNGAMLPGDPFYAAGLIGNFEITYVLLRMCNFKGNPTEKAEHIKITSNALRVRHALSLKSNPYVQVNNLLAAVSDADVKVLQDFQDLPFEIPKKLIFDGDKVSDSLHQICNKWMIPGINFPHVCKHEKARLVMMVNFRIHFASSTLAKDNSDLMLAAAIVNVQDHSLFMYLKRNVFLYRVLRGEIAAGQLEKEKIIINEETGEAHKTVIMEKDMKRNYVTYKSAFEAAKRLDLLDDPNWQAALKN